MSNIYSPEYKALKYVDEHSQNYKEERTSVHSSRRFQRFSLSDRSDQYNENQPPRRSINQCHQVAWPAVVWRMSHTGSGIHIMSRVHGVFAKIPGVWRTPYSSQVLCYDKQCCGEHRDTDIFVSRHGFSV